MAADSGQGAKYCCRPLEKDFKLHEQAWYVSNMEAVRDWLKAAVPDALTPRQDVEQDRALQNLWQESPKECSSSGAQIKIDEISSKNVFRFQRSWRFVFDHAINPQTSHENGLAFFFSRRQNFVRRRRNESVAVQWDRQDKLMEKMNLSGIVKKHKGVVVPIHDSRATHIIVPDPAPSTEDKPDELAGKYHMVVEEQPEVSLVHWWYYPDSYDDWLPKTNFPEESARRFPRNGFVWRVRAKWVLDSTAFNEWMNELDYEVPEPVPMRPTIPMSAPPQPAPTKFEDIPEPVKPAESKQEHSTSTPSSSHGSKKHHSSSSGATGTGGDSSESGGRSHHHHSVDGNVGEVDSSTMLGKEKSRRFKGVYFDTAKETWLAHCYVPSQGKRFIGDFKSEEEAARAYDRAALQNLGHKRASINFNREDYSDLLRELRERDIKLGKDPDRHMGIGEEAQQSKRQKKLVRQGILPPSAGSGTESPQVSSPANSQNKMPSSASKPPLPTPTSTPQQLAVAPSPIAAPRAHAPTTPQPLPHQPLQLSATQSMQQPSYMAKQPAAFQQLQAQPPVPGFQAPTAQVHSAGSLPGTPPVARAVQNPVTSPFVTPQPSTVPPHTALPTALQQVPSVPNSSSAIPQLPCPPHVAAARLFSSKGQALKDTELEPWRTEPFVIPSHASWFRLGSIHPIEKRSMPEFFESERSSQDYVLTRDKIVNLYRDNPHRVLLASDCWRHVAGDAAAAFRIHAFLDQWGLINFEADGRLRFTKSMWAVKPPQIPGLVCAVTGLPIERVRYTSHKAPDIHLSPTAYVAGLFPPNMCASDFVRTVSVDYHPHSLPSYSDWTEEETFRLLEGLDRCGDDWDLVAQYVGSKSIEQCSVHFARLPILDRYLEVVCPTSVKREGREQAFPDHVSFSSLSKVFGILNSAGDDDAAREAVKAARAVFQRPCDTAMPPGDVCSGDDEDVMDVDCGLPFYTATEQAYPADFCGWARKPDWTDAITWPPSQTTPAAAGGAAAQAGAQLSETSPQCRVGAYVVLTVWTPSGPVPRRGIVVDGPNALDIWQVRLCCQNSPWGRAVVGRTAAELRALSPAEVEAVERALGGGFLTLFPCDCEDDDAGGATSDGDLPAPAVSDIALLPPLDQEGAGAAGGSAHQYNGGASAGAASALGNGGFDDEILPVAEGMNGVVGDKGQSERESVGAGAVAQRLAEAWKRIEGFDQFSAAVRELRAERRKRLRNSQT